MTEVKNHTWPFGFTSALLFIGAYIYGGGAALSFESRPPKASQPQQNSSMKAIENPPFDKKLFQSKLIQLIQLNGGFIEPSDVEKAFGGKIVQKNVHADARYVADVVGDNKWFGGFSYQQYTKPYQVDGRIINSGGRLSILIVPGMFVTAESNYCANPVMMQEKLEALGWVTLPREDVPSDYLNTNDFKLKNPLTESVVAVSYGAGEHFEAPVNPSAACILQVTIFGRQK